MSLRLLLLPLLLGVSNTSRCELSTESATFELRIRGTIHFLQIEGGCWQLEGDNGRRYELQPGQAPSSVFRDGARVSLLGQPAEEWAGVCQVGMPLEVRKVVSVE